ncbi:MAG: lysine--tRNA ligase [Clostridia bacterium]|nr:lysine--tRNA ligase [Clostridia bacterium]
MSEEIRANVPVEEAPQQTAEELNEILRVRRQKLKDLQDAGKDPFKVMSYDITAYSQDIKSDYESYEDKEVRMAGRIMSKRIMGKASFANIQDTQGRIQLYVSVNDMEKEAYDDFKKTDIGDIVGIVGKVFKTRTGEISIHTTEVTLLCKSLQPLPEKWHGLKDNDLRYRQRYVDLIVNPEVKKTFITRSRVITEMRRFLDERDFIEVETPVLNTIPGGASARPFITHHNTLDIDMYMRIATELYLKRLIVGGMDRVYEIGRIFRNEGMDIKHNPEFTSIELYQAYTDYKGMMELTENMVASIAERVLGTTKVIYQGTEIDFKPPWRRLTMEQAVLEYTGVDFANIHTNEEADAVAKEKDLPTYKEGMSRGEILVAFFEAYVEDKLIAPTFLMDYPVEVSPLTKRSNERPDLTERFEGFVFGRELCNAYSELNDPIDQKERFMDQVRRREAGDEEANMMDDDFINAMEVGMPPTGGMGLGVDRLVMFLTDSYSIRDVLLFPTMKPTDMPKKADKPVATATAEVAQAEVVEAAPEVIDFSKVEIEPLFQDCVDFETFSKSDFRAVKVKACEAVKKSKKLLQFTLDDGTGVDRTILSGIHAYYEPEELVGKTLIAITNLPPRAMMGIESCGMLLSAVHTVEGEEKLNLLMVDNRIPAGAKLY